MMASIVIGTFNIVFILLLIQSELASARGILTFIFKLHPSHAN